MPWVRTIFRRGRSLIAHDRNVHSGQTPSISQPLSKKKSLKRMRTIQGVRLESLSPFFRCFLAHFSRQHQTLPLHLFSRPMGVWVFLGRCVYPSPTVNFSRVFLRSHQNRGMFPGITLHLVKNICYFPLLVLKGIYHYCFFPPRGLKVT